MKHFDKTYSQNNYSELDPKLLFVNAPEALIYRLTEEYLLKHDFETKERRKPHLSFAENIQSELSDRTRTYLKRNNIILNSYDIYKLNKLRSLMGYRYFIYFGLFNELKPMHDDTSFLYKFEELIKAVTLNQSAFYIAIPDLIFQPSDNIYNENSMANTENTNRAIQYYKLISHLIEFYRNTFKYPVYRLIIPTLIDHEKIYNKNILKIRYNAKIELSKRSLMFYKDFAKVFFDIYLENLEPRDYIFSTNYYVDENALIGYLKTTTTKIDLSYNDNTIKTITNNIELQDYYKLLNKMRARK